MRLLSYMFLEIDASAGKTVAQSDLVTMGSNSVFVKLVGSAEEGPTVIGPYQYVQRRPTSTGMPSTSPDFATFRR